jgi:hypothetical protein
MEHAPQISTLGRSGVDNADESSAPRWETIAGWVLSCLILVPFVPSAFMKIVQPADFLAGWILNFPAGSARPLGVTELLNVALYFVPKTRLLGLAFMTAYLGGAVCFHVHANDGRFFVPILVGAIAWVGLWLRDPKLRSLFPLMKD